MPSLGYWTLDEVAASYGFPLANVVNNWPPLAKALHDWGIGTPLVCIGCIGTIAKESSGFAAVKEAYWLSEEWRRANFRYYPWYGRGLVQTTWESNYRQVQDELARRGIHVDLVGNPDLLLKIEYAAPAMAIFWTGPGRDLVAKCERQDWPRVRETVLGGPDADGVARMRKVASYLLPRARL